MRKIKQLLMHDSAVLLLDNGTGWKTWDSETWALGREFKDWIDRQRLFSAPLPKEENAALLERFYTVASEEYGAGAVLTAQGDVVGPSTINIELEITTSETWVEHITYCGSFTVWWED